MQEVDVTYKHGTVRTSKGRNKVMKRTGIVGETKSTGRFRGNAGGMPNVVIGGDAHCPGKNRYGMGKGKR